MATLAALLDAYWGLPSARLEALSSGHTNKTWRIHAASGQAILRVSWPGKPAEQVRREAAMLNHLATWPGLPSLPRQRLGADAQHSLLAADGRWLHLFHCIPGTPGLPADTAAGIGHAMSTLARLHIAMATLPAHASSPVAWLKARYERVTARRSPALTTALRVQYDEVLGRIGARLADCEAWVPGPARWLHGDYHAGNLLFDQSTVSGVLDFDDVGQGSPWLETAFALFALTRDATRDDRLVFDPLQWDMGLHAYAAVQTHTSFDDLRERRAALIDLFCADQLLIHLEAAQRGLWTPGPGMGFLGCWRQLLDGTVPGL